MDAHTDLDVLVIGEALIDIVERDGDVREHVGGSPANVALGLGRRGLRTALLTQIGRDERGERITAHLSDSCVRVLPESVSADRTSTAAASIGADGAAHYRFDIAWGALPDAQLPSARLRHTGSLAVFLEPGGSSLLELLRRSSEIPLTFDPNIRPGLLGSPADVLDRFLQVARLSTVVKLSDEDAEWLFPGRAIADVVDTLLALGPQLVAVTRGAEGAVIATPAHRLSLEPLRVDVADTIGAGDTFMAALVDSVVTGGIPLRDVAALEAVGREAARAAAITVSRPGADLPWKREFAGE